MSRLRGQGSYRNQPLRLGTAFALLTGMRGRTATTGLLGVLLASVVLLPSPASAATKALVELGKAALTRCGNPRCARAAEVLALDLEQALAVAHSVSAPTGTTAALELEMARRQIGDAASAAATKDGETVLQAQALLQPLEDESVLAALRPTATDFTGHRTVLSNSGDEIRVGYQDGKPYWVQIIGPARERMVFGPVDRETGLPTGVWRVRRDSVGSEALVSLRDGVPVEMDGHLQGGPGGLIGGRLPFYAVVEDGELQRVVFLERAR